MTGVTVPRSGRLRLPGRVWWRDTRAAVLHLLTGALLWLVPLALVLALVSLAVMKKGVLSRFPGGDVDKGTRAIIGFALLGVGFLVLYGLTPRFTAAQRVRFQMTLGVRLVP